MLTVELVKDEDEFRGLRLKWNLVLNNSRSNYFFLTWEWLFSWWQTYKRPDDALCILVVKESDDIVAVAPFMTRRESYYGFNVSKLCFIGEGNSDRSDVFTVKDEECVYETIIKFVHKEIRNWDIIYLREVPDESAFGKYLVTSCAGSELETDSTCPYLSIAPGTEWNCFYSTLSKKIKRDLSNKTNRLKKEGSYEFAHLILKPENYFYVDIIRNIEVTSAKAIRGVELVFGNEDSLGLQKRLFSYSGDNYSILLSMLKLENNVIAYLYGYVFNKKYHAYNMAYLPDYIKSSPGKLVMNDTIRYVIEEGYREFDLLRGASYVKSKWAKEKRKQVHITIFRKGLKNLALRILVFKVRPFLKKLKNYLQDK